MAEEKINDNTTTIDDMHVLRVVLQSIKGISPVSTTANYMPLIDDEQL